MIYRGYFGRWLAETEARWVRLMDRMSLKLERVNRVAISEKAVVEGEEEEEEEEKELSNMF